jgi:hypothetical protein
MDEEQFGYGRHRARAPVLSDEMLGLLRQWWKARPSRYDAGILVQERWFFPAESLLAGRSPPAISTAYFTGELKEPQRGSRLCASKVFGTSNVGLWQKVQVPACPHFGRSGRVNELHPEHAPKRSQPYGSQVCRIEVCPISVCPSASKLANAACPCWVIV